MSTVLRVKRQITDEPLDALVLACKRRKIEESEAIGPEKNDSVTAVVKFAGTVETQDVNVAEHLTKALTKDELIANYKQHIVDITKKSRIRTQEDSKESRYRVVNCFRSQGHKLIDEINDKGLTVIDVEDSVSCAVKECIDEQPQYVYDLYYAQTEGNLEPDNYFSIHPLDQELVFDNYRDPENNSDICESDDSNSESNWRNEYPDSEHSEGSIGEEDMRNAVARIRLEGESSDLSSDEDFVYGLDEDDVDNFGYKYARYKSKVKQGLDDEDSDLDEYSGLTITEVPDEDDDCD